MEISVEFREYLKLFIELLRVVIWPTFSVIILWHFKDIISNAVTRSKEIAIQVAGVKLQITIAEIENTLSDLFKEMDVGLKSHLTVEEKKLFRKILDFPESPTVEQIFPNFNREGSELKILRALRGVYLIRPVEGGNWQSNKHIEITKFGTLYISINKTSFLNNF